MKNAKREMQKALGLAVAFGLFSAAIPAHAWTIPGTTISISNETSEAERSPAALARPVEVVADDKVRESEPAASPYRKSGLSIDELRSVVTDFEVIKEGNKISFAGVIPERCVEGAQVDYSYDREQKAHAVTVSLPGCKEDYNGPKKGEKLVALSSLVAFAPKTLKDESGKVLLRYFKAGDKRSKKRTQDEALLDGDDKEIVHQGSAELEKERLAKEKVETDKKKAEALALLETKVGKFCEAGDFDSLSAELIGAKSLLGDVSKLLERAALVKKAKLEKDLASADTAEKASAAIEAYKAAAAENGWDEDALKETYNTKRFEILRATLDSVKSGDKKQSEADRAIREMARDMRGEDAREFRKQKGTFASLYSEMATAAANDSKYDDSIKLYEKAKTYADANESIKLDGQIAKIYAEQFKECVKKDPTKMGACEAKYIGKAKAIANKIKQQLASRKGDDAASEFAAFQQEYAGTFGSGMEVTDSQYGTLHVGGQQGAIDQFKQQALRDWATNQAQKQQQQMLQQMMGGGVASVPGASGGSSILGIK